jgi:cell division protein FtsL
MLKVNLALALVLLACAMSVVSARHTARQLFVTLQQEQSRARELDTEWGRLLLEQSTWAMHTRVEVVARHQLQMSVPDPVRIHLIRPAREEAR